MAQIQKGTTYITGDQVTAANLNALADSAILLAGAITDQTAKTVPLAADTVLIHSAADTALRKSTLTQVFANATGIPISTGISGLGTGVATALAVNVGTAGAPVVNGGALGTPSSGTVTNLTGTASINTNGAHNGTVGATTPSTVAATTISATGLLTVSTTSTSAALLTGNNSATGLQIVNTGATASNYIIQSGGTAANALSIYNVTGSAYVAAFTSTGLNSCAIGATTPSTGAFTTVSATDNLTLSTGVISRGQINGSVTGPCAVYDTIAATGNNRLISFGKDNSTNGFFTISSTRANGSNNVDVASITSTGLAVTGALSASGSAIFGNTSTPSTSVPGTQINNPFSVGPSIFSQSSATGNRWIDFMGSSATLASFTNDSGVFSIQSGGGKANISSTGLAVTGALSSTGNQSMISGASTVSRSEYQGATSVAGSATSIVPAGLGYGALCLVNGYQSGNQFADVVAVAGTTATALFSGTVSGSPAARTYTVVSNVLKLSMASGTYTVTAKQESLNAL